MSKKDRKLPKRTWLSFLVIFLLVPALVLLGGYLGGRSYYLIGVCVIVLTSVLFFLVFEQRQPQAREVVTLAVLCALAVASRAAFMAIPHFKPMMAIVMIAGFASAAEPRGILWSKRCKDESLRGTVKETIMQVSRSKKWESKPVLDENGTPMINAKGKTILKSSYSVLQDDFFHFMQAAGYEDVERGERGSTEEHLTVTQFKVQAEQQRLEVVTGQVAQAEQSLEDAKVATEKQKKKLEALQKETKAAKTIALTVQDIEGMGKKNAITGNVSLTQDQCETLKRYAVNGIIANADNKRLKEKRASAEKSVSIWRQRHEKLYEKYEELKKEVQPYLEAVKLAPEKVRAFLHAVLTRTRDTKIHEQPVRRKQQDMDR